MTYTSNKEEKVINCALKAHVFLVLGELPPKGITLTLSLTLWGQFTVGQFTGHRIFHDIFYILKHFRRQCKKYLNSNDPFLIKLTS